MLEKGRRRSPKRRKVVQRAADPYTGPLYRAPGGSEEAPAHEPAPAGVLPVKRFRATGRMLTILWQLMHLIWLTFWWEVRGRKCS